MSPAENERPERVLNEYLVVLSQAGGVDALEHLARRWTPRLLRYAARVLGGSADTTETAREVVQETWVGAMRGLRSLRDPAQFPAWIYGIATRKCADAIRASTRRREVDIRAAAATATAEQRPITAEDRFDLATAILGLPPEQRAVLHLFYGDELRVDEIASALAIPAGTVKSRLHYAREALKSHLGTGGSVRSNLMTVPNRRGDHEG